MNMIKRSQFLQTITQSFKMHSVVALLGPRQCGKTTLARTFAQQALSSNQPVEFFDLEDPAQLNQLQQPQLALERLNGLIIIDEIQKRPDLFPLLRVLVDRPNSMQKYLILGSASRDLIKQSSETLAGRIAFVELTPFNLQETGNSNKHWLTGGFPRAFLAPTTQDSFDWRANYIRTFLERDIPDLGINIPAEALRRFWNMLAHCHGNILNRSELGQSLGVAHTTITRHLEILVGTFMVRELKPWYENIAKRQVKQSKIYLRDSGLLHYFLGILEQQHLYNHPKLGASWEGFALEEVIRKLKADAEECYFWRTHQGAELDLLIFRFSKKIGFEFKYRDAPSMTKSLHSVIDNLNPEKIYIIYPGKADYLIHEKVEVMPLQKFITLDKIQDIFLSK